MFGKNPIRPPEKGDGTTLQVVAIFPTLQGEGPFAGHPAVFVRLGGCNLACDFCDTEFETFEPMSIESILKQVTQHTQCDLVVITGGEPLRQEITPFCELLLSYGYRVQIETNGTLFRNLPEDINIVCSPKMSGGHYHAIRPDLLGRIDALKFIISATHPDYRDVGDVGQSTFHTPVYVQPMDEGDPAKNAANQQRALTLAMEHGYRLSLQTHKLLGIA